MRFSTVAAAATALVGSTMAADHLVVVGNGSNIFEPNSIKAAEGDTVTFKFWPKNHSVAQAAFASPCEPMNNGFWSGFIPSTEKAANTTFMYTVENASQPIWFYCSQAKHCQGGMVGVINPPASGNTIEKFADAAKSASNNVSPSSTAGEGGMLMNGTSSMSPSSSSSGAASTGAASTLSANNNIAFTGLLGMFAYLLL